MRLFSLFVLFLLAIPASAEPPLWSKNGGLIDYGRLCPEKKLAFHTVFVNTGTEPVYLQSMSILTYRVGAKVLGNHDAAQPGDTIAVDGSIGMPGHDFDTTLLLDYTAGKKSYTTKLRLKGKVPFDLRAILLGELQDSIVDCGLLEKQDVFRKEFLIVNNTKQPFFIDAAGTGDGGSYMDYSREPIMPGKTGKLVFVQDLRQRTRFTRSVYVQYNVNGCVVQLHFTITGRTE